ncbi:hypothetical protein [Hirschia litorea]|uniref:CBM-cenC domain-containing protein n=1 Tax=Hirschia litorea TaxID=1199156 RepID=A0ABW2IPK9_9PROT
MALSVIVESGLPVNAQPSAAELEYIAELNAVLPGELLNNPAAPEYKANGADFKTKTVKTDKIAGGVAYQVRVKRNQSNLWDVAVHSGVYRPVVKGNKLLLAFWARSSNESVENIQVRVQESGEPYGAALEGQISIGPEWALYEIKGSAQMGLGAESCVVSFNVGGSKKMIELGQFFLIDQGR